MSNLPQSPIEPAPPDVQPAIEPTPQGPDIAPASTPEEAPSPATPPDDGRAYD